MSGKLILPIVVLVSLLPILAVALDFDWIDVLTPRPVESMAGRYAFPSGLLYDIDIDAKNLVAGTPPLSFRRVNETLYVTSTRHVRLQFELGAEEQVLGLQVHGFGPTFSARRVAADAPDPTRRVDAGGHRLRILVAGPSDVDGPTIVLEGSLFGSLEGFAGLQGDLARITRTVAYDHAGTGGSEAGPGPRSVKQVARELHTALGNADIMPPYVLVGSSFAGSYVRVFAHMFPRDIGGIVLIDPSPDPMELFAWLDAHAPNEADETRRGFRWGETGVDAFLRQRQNAARAAEWLEKDATFETARNAWPLPDVPIVQITGAEDYQLHIARQRKVEYFSAWLNQHIPSATHILAEKSRHGIYGTEPELVIDTIRKVVDSARI